MAADYSWAFVCLSDINCTLTGHLSRLDRTCSSWTVGYGVVFNRVHVQLQLHTYVHAGMLKGPDLLVYGSVFCSETKQAGS